MTRQPRRISDLHSADQPNAHVVISPRSRVIRVLILLVGLVIPQAILFGPSMLGLKVLLPLDLLAMETVYLPSESPDLEVTEKIKIYDRGFTVNEDPQQRRGILVDYRTGDIWSPHVERVEPLQVMVSHFADCILHEKRPRTDGEVGLRVVRILEAAQRSIKGQEGRVML